MTGVPGVEGRLAIRLDVARGRVAGVTIDSSRPTHLGRIFQGQPAPKALHVMPLVFAVCGTAQSVAGLRAVEQASGRPAAAAHETARELILGVETAREHLTRILTDWSRCLGRSQPRDCLARIHQWPTRAAGLLYPEGDFATPGGGRLAPGRAGLVRLTEEIDQAIQAAVLGVTPASFLATMGPEDLFALPGRDPKRLGPAFLAWLQASGRAGWGNAATAPLPNGDKGWLAEVLAGDRDGAFVARPRYRGQSRETTPFSRNRDHPLVKGVVQRWGSGLMARHTARLVELAALPARLDRLSQELAESRASGLGGLPAGDGCGLGTVEAARGQLAHWTALENETIREYRILAPTEWNFHPEGVLARALEGMRANCQPDRIRERASMVVRALDPCIGFDIEVRHA
jgi:Ni,Fe-hydrogenase I large subunit